MLFILSLLLFIVSILIVLTISYHSRNLRFSKAIALTTSFMQKIFTKDNASSDNKTIIIKTSFFTKLKSKLTSPEFIISTVFTVLFGMASRHFILIYWDIDVFKELVNFIALGHFTVLAVVRTMIQLLLEHLGIGRLTLNMNSANVTGVGAGNQQTGQGANVVGTGQSANPQPVQAINTGAGQPANPQAGQVANNWGNPDQPAAGKELGPIQVNDPLGQLARGYIAGGVNQPLLDNIGSALEDQFLKGRRHLSRRMFTQQQETFILDHLRHTKHEVWLNIVGVEGYLGGPPRWKNQRNTAEFRSNFWID